MKYSIVLLTLLATGCSSFQNDLTMFREEAVQCPGHVILDVTQVNGQQTLNVRCEWNAPVFVEQPDTPVQAPQ